MYTSFSEVTNLFYHTRFGGVAESTLKRLKGTQVSLIGPSTNTTCGTIDSVSLDVDLEHQTYTVPCPPTSEPTLAVFLYDALREPTDTAGYLIIRIVEVMIFTSALPCMLLFMKYCYNVRLTW